MTKLSMNSVLGLAGKLKSTLTRNLCGANLSEAVLIEAADFSDLDILILAEGIGSIDGQMQGHRSNPGELFSKTLLLIRSKKERPSTLMGQTGPPHLNQPVGSGVINSSSHKQL